MLHVFYSTVVNMVAVVVIRKISYNENLLEILTDISVYLSYQAECKVKFRHKPPQVSLANMHFYVLIDIKDTQASR